MTQISTGLSARGGDASLKASHTSTVSLTFKWCTLVLSMRWWPSIRNLLSVVKGLLGGRRTGYQVSLYGKESQKSIYRDLLCQTVGAQVSSMVNFIEANKILKASMTIAQFWWAWFTGKKTLSLFYWLNYLERPDILLSTSQAQWAKKLLFNQHPEVYYYFGITYSVSQVVCVCVLYDFICWWVG